jgi:hypothetical protein
MNCKGRLCVAIGTVVLGWLLLALGIVRALAIAPALLH